MKAHGHINKPQRCRQSILDGNFLSSFSWSGNWCRSSAAAVYQRHYGKTQSVKLLFREAAQMWFLAVHFFSSMSSTGRFPSGLQRFLNATVHPFCVACKVPLEKNIFKEKIISLVPFYPALCCSVHLGKCSSRLISAAPKDKFKFSVSVFSSLLCTVRHNPAAGLINLFT